MLNIPCNLCGAGAPRLIHQTPDGRRINRCQNCGFIYVNPVPDIAEIATSHQHGCYELYGEKYETLLEKKTKEWREVYNTLANHTPVGPLLDIGCGRGYCMALAKELGWRPVGVDIALEDIEFARKTHSLTVHQGPLPIPELPQNHFNAAIMWSLIEHLHDPATILRETYKLLAPGGVISISTCNVDSRAAKQAGADWEYYKFSGHLSFFTPATLAKMTQNAGYEIIDISGGIELGDGAMNTLKTSTRAALAKILPPSAFNKIKKLAVTAAAAGRDPSTLAGENFILFARKP